MSSIVISGDSSGSISLQAPAVAGTTTLTLPATTGTVLNDATCGVCRAWVNFNGTGTVAIRASFNVSSITDGGVGIYTVNFTNNLPDTNYSAIANVNYNGSGSLAYGVATGSTMTTGSVSLTTANQAGQQDYSVVSVAIFR